MVDILKNIFILKTRVGFTACRPLRAALQHATYGCTTHKNVYQENYFMRSKTRLIAAIASLLVCLAMVGTGFASWVILQDKTVDASGNVKAEAVSEDGLSFSLTSPSSVDILFTGPKEQTTGGAWLYSDGATGSENLEVTFEFTISGAVGSIDIGYDESSLQSAIDSHYIQKATWSIVSVTNSSLNTDVLSESQAEISGSSVKFGTNGYKFTDGKISIKLSYKWGEMFTTSSGVTSNPYVFFNAKNKNTKVQDDENYSSGLNLSTYYSSYSSDNWDAAARKILSDLYTKVGTTGNLSINITFTAHQAKATA